jgi:hypothetical protein
MGSTLFAAARANPESLLLLAAGAALLLRGGISLPSPRGRSGRGPQDDTLSTSTRRWVDTDRVTETMEGARDYVSDLGSQAADTAASYASSASRYAGEMGHTVAVRSEQLYEDTTSTLSETGERILRDQPLVVALAGLAAGAALAAAFPRTEFEARTLGPGGERVAEFAAETAEEFKQAGVAAGERLKSAADQRGLNPDGMKDMAREAADAFAGSLSGNKTSGRPNAEPSNKERPA